MMIAYKCRCMKAEQELPVPDRRAGGDLNDWMHMITTCVSTDHRALSPLCQATAMEFVKVPTEEGAAGIGIPLRRN